MKHSKLAVLGLVVLGSALAAPIAFAQSTTGTQDATTATQDATTTSQSQDQTATQSGTTTGGTTTDGTTTDSSTTDGSTTQGTTGTQGATTTQGQDAWSQGTGSDAATTQGSATHDGGTHSAGAATGTAPGGAARQVTWTDLDADKDGSLSKTEVTQLPSLSQVFDQADADADSKLTADEYKAYVAKNGKSGSASGN